MGPDLGLADRLRAKGLSVVEIDGWQDRGRTYATFNPRGSVNHHTAGGLGGNAPSLGICINGRADLPGPLCQVMQARDNVCYVVAAGVANHAGAGGWRGLVGNQTVHGLEVENTGYDSTEPWRDDQIDTMAKVHSAFLEYSGAGAEMVCQHYEWTPAKIDAHDIGGDGFRARVAAYIGWYPGSPSPSPVPPPPIIKDDTMEFFIFPQNPGYDSAVWCLTVRGGHPFLQAVPTAEHMAGLSRGYLIPNGKTVHVVESSVCDFIANFLCAADPPAPGQATTGGGDAPLTADEVAAIAKAVNDDAAKRLSA